ncbi:MAG: sigma 54-interacting transcriptional regulator [Firmicutes bacterium]|nr:sigma 54-interacting transcriptional regulator [Bacillota bacterium]
MEHFKDPFAGIIGNHPKILKARNIAKRVAKGDSSIILYGETGTGKEAFARAIHKASPRRKRPFIPVNCAAIPESLIESELFGYEPGSFTGALKKGKIGKFQAANLGTIFLDEICDMSLLLQAKLLRTIQDRTVERIGSPTPTPVDIRFITATNKNLEEMMRDFAFREDLYYRLNVIKIQLPPLRERLTDIKSLSEFFMPYLNIRCKTQVNTIHPDVIKIFMGYHWPGNIRELQNVLEYAMNFTDNNVIRTEHLPPVILRHARPENQNKTTTKNTLSLNKAVTSAEHSTLINALQRCGNNRTEAARLLGISRSTLYEKLKKHCISYETTKSKFPLPTQSLT